MFLSNISTFTCKYKGRSLFDALGKHDLGLLKKTLKEQPELINLKSCDGLTPLHYLAGGCLYSGIRMPIEAQPPKKYVQLLLTAGSEVNEKTKRGNTALNIAAATGYFIMIKELLNHKQTKLDISGENGNSALHSAILSTACFDPYFRTESLLLKAKPDLVHSLDDSGNTPLFAIMDSISKIENSARVSQNTLYNNLDRIKNLYVNKIPQKISFLLEHGALVEKEKYGEVISAFEIGLKQLDPVPTQQFEDLAFRPILLELCKKTKSIDKKDPRGWNSLHWAAYTQCLDVVEELLKRGLNPDEKDNFGLSAKDIATLQVNRPMLKLMGEELDETIVTPKKIAELALSLPKRGKLPYYYDEAMRNAVKNAKIYTTGLFDLSFYSGRKLEKQIHEIYSSLQGNPSSTRMGWAIRNRDYGEFKKMVDDGWTLLVDYDFHFHANFARSEMITINDALKGAFEKDPSFYHKVVTYLDKHKWTGITISSEFNSALKYRELNKEKAMLLIDMGLNHDNYIRDPFHGSPSLEETISRKIDFYQPDRGIYYPEFPAMMEIDDYARKQGWMNKE